MTKEPIYISYIVNNFTNEQFGKINDLNEIKEIKNLVSWEIVKNKSIIKKLENNKRNYGYYGL